MWFFLARSIGVEVSTLLAYPVCWMLHTPLVTTVIYITSYNYKIEVYVVLQAVNCIIAYCWHAVNYFIHGVCETVWYHYFSSFFLFIISSLSHFFFPDCLHGLLPGPFLLSYSVFILFFPLFFVSEPCTRLNWPSRQLLSAR